MQYIDGTKIISVFTAYDLDKLTAAAAIIRQGGLVAFPTETVYGLGSNALDPEAAARTYAAKGRPSDNPLIVHVSAPEQLLGLVRSVPAVARSLIDTFWPGPLTLVFEASEAVPRATTGGLDTVAIRMPAHPTALALIEACGCPLAGPSANASGRPSPTTAQHVIHDLAGKIDMVIDSGPTGLGIESTVLDITVDPPEILRPGGLTLEQLRAALPQVQVDPTAVQDTMPLLDQVRAPGMKYKHYAPEAEVIVVEGAPEAIAARIGQLYDQFAADGRHPAIMATRETRPLYGKRRTEVVGSRTDLSSVAARLFEQLRRFDSEDVDVVLAEGVDTVGLGLAVMNRLRKAAGYQIVKV